MRVSATRIRRSTTCEVASKAGQLCAVFLVLPLAVVYAKACVPGTVSFLAGNASGTGGLQDGLGTNANFRSPFSAVADDSGKIYVADECLIRVMEYSTAAVTTLAGGGSPGGSAYGIADGVGSAATFIRAEGVALDLRIDSGILFVVDSRANLVRIVDVSTRMVTTLAGGGGEGGSAAGYANGIGRLALFKQPTGVAAEAGMVYIADNANNVIRVIVASTGSVTTLAGGFGSGTVAGHLDAVGTAASFSEPYAVSTNGAGLLIVADSKNNLLRAIDLASVAVTTIAGGGCENCLTGGFVDGVGSAAMFAFPRGLVVAGDVAYVGDFINNVIRAVDLVTGTVTTLSGGGSPGGTQSGFADGVGTAALINGWGIALLSPSTSDLDSSRIVLSDYFNNIVRTICPLAPPPSPSTMPPAGVSGSSASEIDAVLVGSVAGGVVCAMSIGAALLWVQHRSHARRRVLQHVSASRAVEIIHDTADNFHDKSPSLSNQLEDLPAHSAAQSHAHDDYVLQPTFSSAHLEDSEESPAHSAADSYTYEHTRQSPSSSTQSEDSPAHSAAQAQAYDNSRPFDRPFYTIADVVLSDTAAPPAKAQAASTRSASPSSTHSPSSTRAASPSVAPHAHSLTFNQPTPYIVPYFDRSTLILRHPAPQPCNDFCDD